MSLLKMDPFQEAISERERRREAYLAGVEVVSKPIEKIPYQVADGPQLPEWDEDFPNRVDTHGIGFFNKKESSQTGHLTGCVPVVVKSSDGEGALLHVAGGIEDLTMSTYSGESKVHRQRSGLRDFIEKHPDAEALIVRSAGRNEWIMVVDDLMDMQIPLKRIIDVDFNDGKRINYDLAYRADDDAVLINNKVAHEVWMFNGFQE